MRLLLDQGNSRLKWALASSDGCFVQRGVGASLVDAFVSGQRSDAVEPELVVIACVAGKAVLDELVAAVVARWPVPVLVLRTPVGTAGLINGYAAPEKLGVDRWLAMLGARTLSTGASLVVDAGTAVTIDAIDPRGHHLGGYIVPGIHLQHRALNVGTAAIEVEGGLTPSGWGRNTAEAVSGGVLLGLASLVERAVVELESSVADTCSLILTGGDAGVLSSALRTSAVIDRDLVFRGMLVQIGDARGYIQVVGSANNR